MFQVQYRCIYRDVWYDHDDVMYDIDAAVMHARRLAAQTNRKTRVWDQWTGRVYNVA